ncbi:MAG: hydrogenase expression protein HypB [Bacillaceae bacterium]|nr:hydrogenase expression protein HypB [Bacillaceae bacterium]
MKLPEQFVQNIKHVHKAKGKKWLNRLPDLISECADRWDLHIHPHFDLSYSYVSPAMTRNQREVVIKLGIPDEEFNNSLEALKLFDGNGVVQLIDAVPEKGMLLMERITPGTMLALQKDDKQATRIATQVMKKIWKPAPLKCCLPTTLKREESLATLINEYPEGIGPIQLKTLEEALDIFKYMNQQMETRYLLHGDLHHYNILKASGESWVAIDPKGLIGEREYDVIQFLLNKLPEGEVASAIQNRMEIFADELNLNFQKIALWGYAHSVLATAWTVQDDGSYDEIFFKTIDVFKDIAAI